MTPAMAIDLAQRRVNEFRQRCGDYGEMALHLAYHAALPVALNAEFLHLLRINFFLDPPEPLPYTAEFEFLLSPLCREIDEGLYEIEPEIRDVLLAGLTQTYDSQRTRDIATLLWQYVEHHSPWSDRIELERAQQLTALNFLDPTKAQQWLATIEPNASQSEAAEREWYVAMRQEIENQTQVSQKSLQRKQQELVAEQQTNQFEAVLRSLSDSQTWTLQGEVTRIGRAENNDVVLLQPEVSRQHAEIFYYLSIEDVTSPTHFLRDFSRWGTWMLTPGTEGWQRIHNREVMLPSGTQLKFGSPQSTALEFSVTPTTPTESLGQEEGSLNDRSSEQDNITNHESSKSNDAALEEVNRLNDLAKLYTTQGRYVEAESLYIQVLELRRQIVGEEHPDTISSLVNLADIYAQQGQVEQAIELYQRSLALYELSRNVQGKAATLNKLADIYAQQGQVQQAIELYQQSLALTESIGDVQGKAATLHQLASIYAQQGQVQQAIDLYKQVLSIDESIGDVQGKAATLHQLAIIYTQQRQVEQAIELYQQSFACYESIGDVQGKTATLNNLAWLYNLQGRYGEAESLYIHALEINQSQLGDHHPNTASSLSSLADLYRTQGRYSEAESLYEQALALYRQVLGEDHPFVTQSVNNLAALHNQMAARSQSNFSTLPPGQRRRLEKEKASLEKQIDSLTRQLQNLQRDHAAETNAANRLRLQKQIEAIDLELEQLSARLEGLDRESS